MRAGEQPASHASTGSRNEPLARVMGRKTSVMAVLTFAASITNYGSNLVFGRMLTPSAFGDLTALLALAVIVATPTSAAQTVMAERVAWHRARGDEQTLRYLIRHATAHVLLISVLVGLVYTACIPIVVKALDLQAPGPAIALVPLIVLLYFFPYAMGILQGLDRFVAFGGMLLGIAVMRIALGVPWILAGGGAGGAIAGQALGILLGLFVVAWILRRWRLPRGTGAATSGLRRRINARAASATVAFAAFAAISNLDILLANIFLPADGTGQYAALVTIEKVVLFLPSAVAFVMVPAAARARLEGNSAAAVLRVSALLVGATTAVVAVPAAVAPGFVLHVMFGSGYSGAVGGVLPILVAGCALALLNLLVTYTVTIRDGRWVLLLFGGVVAQVVAISALHDSATEIAIVQAGVVVLVLVLNEVLFHPILRTSQGRAVAA